MTGKLPRNLSGRDLAVRLSKFGYKFSHQSGSHMRYVTEVNGRHSITIVDERPLNVKTLGRLLKDVATHHNLTLHQLIDDLFG